MPYKAAMNSLGGLRRRQQYEPTPSHHFYGSTNLESAMSPMVFRAPKNYDIAIADNPVRYAVINAPFLKLRKRTESLLDQITGGTLPAEILEQERRQKDMERQLKCRGCKVVFGSEEGLNGHLRLFPSHVNPPEYKRKQKRNKKKSRARRSHSTSDVASSAASITSSRRSGRHARSNTIALPITTPGSHLHTLQQAPATAPRTFEEAVELVRERNDLVRPSAPRILPDIPMVQPEWPEENNLASPPRLPALDFGSFQDISPMGAREIPLARPIPIKEDKPKPLIDYEERNTKAGAYAALRSMTQREEEQRRKNRPVENPTLPGSFSGMVKAVIATGQSERAVMPSPPGAYVTALHDITNIERGPTPPPKSAAMPSRKLTVRNPSPHESTDVEESKGSIPEAIKTEPVMTSFSSQDDITTPDNHNTTTFTNVRKLLRRRSTNPFLNESFMSSLPLAKTPPLSPTTPFTMKFSPGNPFLKMAESDVEDHVDDFYDAPDTPPPMEQAPVFLRKRTNTNPFFAAVEEDEEEEDQYQKGKGVVAIPLLPSSSLSSRRIPRSASYHVTSTQQVYSLSPSRGVHFEHQAALKADDNPRCPSCRRAFIDLTSVLIHLERSACHQSEFNETQVTEAY